MAAGTRDLRAFARQIYPVLDERSYYELLGVPPSADTAAIRRAFYAAAADLHPDRYHTLADAQVKEQLETIYARACEGYRVLTSPDRRAVYDRGLAAGKLRFDATAREAPTVRNPEDLVKHPEAKKFFRLGMLCLGKKDWKGAAMNFTFARGFEPGAAVIAEKLAEAQAAQKGAPR